jgi:hypothetical protein
VPGRVVRAGGRSVVRLARAQHAIDAAWARAFSGTLEGRTVACRAGRPGPDWRPRAISGLPYGRCALRDPITGLGQQVFPSPGTDAREGIMKIVVMGAGALGGYFGGRLAQAGHEVWLIARGAHLEAMREEGLRLISPCWCPRPWW